jgi:glutaredoxin
MNTDAPLSEIARDVIVYFSPACPHCHHLMTYLDVNNIVYEGRDVTQLPSARDEIQQLTVKLEVRAVEAILNVYESVGVDVFVDCSHKEKNVCRLANNSRERRG